MIMSTFERLSYCTIRFFARYCRYLGAETQLLYSTIPLLVEGGVDDAGDEVGLPGQPADGEHAHHHQQHLDYLEPWS